MASLAEAMFAAAVKNISDTKSDPSAISRAFQGGAQLAQRQQQIDQKQQQIVQQKKKVKASGVSNVFKVMETAEKFKDQSQKAKFLKQALPATVAANGVEDIFSPEMVEGLQTSQEVRQGMGIIQSKVKRGEMSFEEGVAASQNLDQILDFSNLAEAEKFHIEQTGKTERANIVASGQVARQQVGIVAKQAAVQEQFAQIGPKTVAAEVASEFVDFKTKGKRAGLKLNLKNLKVASKRLKSGEVNTGTLSTKFPGLGGDAIQSILNQEMLNIENDARAAIMPLLRATMGTQFTEKEGTIVFGTVFNRQAPPKENARRIDNKVDELEDILRGKEDSFVKHGHMTAAERDFDAAPKRQRESDSQSDFSPEAIENVVNTIQNSEKFKNLNGEQLFDLFKNLPNLEGVPDDKIRAMIKQVQVKLQGTGEARNK